jgi:hypothetical protein
MTPDGRFVEPPRPGVAIQWLRIAFWGTLLVTAAVVGAILLWFSLLLIPVALAAAAITGMLHQLRRR